VNEPVSADRWTKLLAAIEHLKTAASMDQVVEIVRGSARAVAGADGVTVVRRVGGRVHYVAEDAMSPLWTGQDFPIDQCISGMAIMGGEPILIPDISMDPRVPLQLYMGTFVRSMAMFPVGIGPAVAAIGVYWRQPSPIHDETVALFESLARSMGAVLYNLENIDHATSYRAGARRNWGAQPRLAS
jgi:hypothetical protein